MNKAKKHVAPYCHGKSNSVSIMLCVIVSLLPAAITGCLNFGMPALIRLLVTTGTAILTEAFVLLIVRRNIESFDFSAAITGLLLGMMLPSDFPILWASIGSAFAILIVKQLFGGIGKNFANPALTAKALLMLCFMREMHTFHMPHSDTTLTATELSHHASWWDAFLGNTHGCIGETCAAGLLAGGIFLCLMGIISPTTPISFLGIFAFLMLISGEDPIYEMLSGGLLLGAFFMATDYTTTPLTEKGKLFFGLGCGILTFIIRKFGGYTDGAGLAILCMNLFTPTIDRITAAKPFGAMPIEHQKNQPA